MYFNIIMLCICIYIDMSVHMYVNMLYTIDLDAGLVFNNKLKCVIVSIFYTF